MAIGFDDEFDYLDEDEDSEADEKSFAPKIKGSKKSVALPSEETEKVENSEEQEIEEINREESKEKPKEPEKNFESVIFIVKVTTNKEDKAFEMVVDRVNKKGLEVYSIARPHGLRGYIILEAVDRENAEEAVFNLPYVKGIIGKTVTYGEVKQMLEPITADVNIEKNDIIEIISEPFKNEKAKVVRVDKIKGECVVSLLGAAVPIPVTIKIDNLRVIRREDLDEE